jgi:hypothetical protein
MAPAILLGNGRSKLGEKVETALNETRILMLVVEILIGFQFQAAFTKGFERLPLGGRELLLVSLAFQIVVLALLVLPPAYHRIVDEGRLTANLCRLTTNVVGVALVLLAAAFAVQFAVITAPILGTSWAVACGTILGLIALFLWWGLELIQRSRRPHSLAPDLQCKDGDMSEDSPLSEKIKFALTETRVVLPGAQALLGFQLAVILSEPFASLPDALKRLHLISLAGIAISTMLLMAPAAYHRIVEGGESTEPVLKFTSRMLLAAMVFLALGIAGDVYVVTDKVLKSAEWSAAAALATLAASYGMWFGYTLYTRAHAHPRIIDASRASAP